MTVRRLFIFMLLPIMMLLLWSAPVSAWDKEVAYNSGKNAFSSEAMQQKLNSSVKIEGEGECKLDDSYKKRLAADAYNAIQKARNNLVELVNLLRKHYESEGGACYYLHDTIKHLGFGKSDIESKSELEWTEKSWIGCGVLDSEHYGKLTGSTCKEIIDNTETAKAVTGNEDIDIKNYTDYDIGKLKDLAIKADEKYKQMESWLKGAKTGDTFTITPDLVKYFENAGLKAETFTHLIKLENGGVACVKTDVSHQASETPGPDGLCHDRVYDDFTGELVSDKARPCKKETYDPKKSLWSYPSADKFLGAISKGDNKTSTCINELDKMIVLRGKEGREEGYIGQRKRAWNALSILGGAETQCTCQKGEDEKPTDQIARCDSLDDEFVVDNMEYTCPTIGEYQAELGEICLTCGLMANILGAGQKISEQAFVAISDPLIELLEVAFLIYIAYTVLLIVASPEPQKLSKLLTSLLTQGARVAIAILILLNPEYLYDKAINPILDGAVDFGLAFSNVSVSKEGEGGTIKEVNESFGEEIRKAGADYTKNLAPESKFLGTPTLEKMVGANKNFSKEAAFMPALGRCLICHATHNLPSGAPHYEIIPRVKMLITGLILLIFGAMIWLAVGFYILDCCLQLCLITAMMSFFVACWPFKLTNSYVKVGWNMFLNTFFSFVMMSVIIVTIALLTGQAVQRLGMTEEVNNNNVDQIEKNLELIGLGIIIMVVVCLICLKLSTESSRLANKFAGGAQIKMGGDLGGMAAGAVTQGGKATLKTTGKALGKTGGSIAESSGLKGAATAAKQGIKGALGGGTKSKGASFKQNDAANKGGGDKGGKEGGKEGGDDKGGREGGEKSPESGSNE